MLYKIYENMTNENLDKMKYLLTDDLAKRHLEKSSVRKHNQFTSFIEREGIMTS